jgi:hypothetical protein
VASLATGPSTINKLLPQLTVAALAPRCLPGRTACHVAKEALQAAGPVLEHGEPVEGLGLNSQRGARHRNHQATVAGLVMHGCGVLS